MPLEMEILIVGEPTNPTVLSDECSVDSAPVQTQWLPAVGLIATYGLWMIALANTAALASVAWAEWGFWLGLLCIIGPVAWRLMAAEPARAERIGLVVLLGMTLFLVKVMHSPFEFTYGDEFYHLYNANAIINNGVLFTENTGLPASALYPGLELMTAALVSVSGMSVFHAGLVVIGVARLVLVLAVYLLLEAISGSARVAGVATALYMTHPNFLFWTAQFSYESLSLPLALGVFVAVARRDRVTEPAHAGGFTVLALLGIGAVVVTHHLTSYFLAVFLSLWSIMAAWRLQDLFRDLAMTLVEWRNSPHIVRRFWFLIRTHWQALQQRHNEPFNAQSRRGPGGLPLLAWVAALGWLLLVAGVTVSYLSPIFGRAVLSLLRVIAGESTGRQLFVSNSGHVAPLWERVIGLTSVLLMVIGVGVGLRHLWRRQRWEHPLILLLAGAPLIYFALQGLRFTPAGWETALRTAAYLFVGLAFVVALAFVGDEATRGAWPQRFCFVIYLAVLLMGAVIGGWPSKLRLSQPYRVAVGDQMIEPQGRAAATWAHTMLGTRNRMAADEVNGRFMLTYGDQAVLIGSHRDINQLLEAPVVSNWQVHILQFWQLSYVLMDRRRISWNNMEGYYFAPPDQPAATRWLAAAAIEKFDQQPGANRILDTGDLVIYDVKALRDAQ